MDQTHPDPFREAMHQGLQRAMHVGSLVVTAAQVHAYHQRTQTRSVSERDERARRALHGQIRAERDAARAGWAPANDPKWLRQAGFMDTARAWGAAMPYADRAVPWYEPSAATAMHRCEQRLREHHPYAMARYDRLRADGLGPGDAMRQAAPFFAREPYARDASVTPRSALSPGDGTGLIWVADAPVAVPPPGPDVAALERRGHQILTALQDRARAQGRAPLGADEQRTVLETVTDLPPDLIDRIVQPVGSARSPGARPGPGATRDDRPWQNDFPTPIQDVVATAADTLPTPAASGARRQAPGRRTGRPPARRP